MIEANLRKYIIPNVLAMIGTSCYVLADTFFIATAAGANGITALNLALPLYGIIFAIGSMIGIGSATRYALLKPLGRGEEDDYFGNAVFWTLLISLPFVAAGILCPDAILRMMGADDAILETGLTYVRIVLCFTPFFMLNYTVTAFVRNDGSPNIAMAATLGSGIFNIIFDYLFMFPLGLGMAGAAWATVVSPVVSMAVCLMHYLSKKNTIRFSRKMPSFKKLLFSCSLGIVAFVGEISSGITTMVFNFVLLDLLGNIGVAAYGVVANLALVGTALFNGVSQGLQPMASEVHGKADDASEKRIYKESLRISVRISVILVGAVLLFAESLVGVFNSEQSAALAAYAVPGMRLYFLGFLIAAVNIVRAGFFSAVEHGRDSSLISLLRGVAAITVFAFLLPKLFGVAGVWLAFPASELFTLLVSQLFLRQRAEK